MKLNRALAFGFLASAAAIPLLKRDYAIGTAPVRGANIGGWLVLEPWITPSIFHNSPAGVVDEYTFSQNVSNARDILRAHWDNWVTLADFQKIADNGFNAVRIPIGYWAFKKYAGEPYILDSQQAHLDRALEWARQTGLKVWIDLHGAPRSQNGFDNSGRLTDTPSWTSGDSVAATTEVIRMIANKYAAPSYADVVAAIELLNEPLMSNLPGGRAATQAYYQTGFDAVRAAAGSDGTARVVIQDGFASPPTWNGFLAGEGLAGAVVDHHEYQVFTNELVALSPQQHVDAVCGNAKTWATGQDKWLVVGEFTGAMTDCAPALNGYGVGARYDGTYSKRNADGSYTNSTSHGTCAHINWINDWTEQNKTDTRNYINAQLDVFEQRTQGWFWWNFKTEAAAEWDLFRLLDAGIFPKLEGRQRKVTC
ncbi:putative glucan -beta-glucosidase precursor protein [Lasiodiplodia theobromae]|uniref:Glucan 1,3-beta-glucosidase n=2 Tax=Lasiodiplodia TaxID=66739 RepID=A0A5N5DAP0_9PEZI|nr:Glucan 1,3-beta-glucosidase [Lasiodiplodia theobromae]KAF9635691.1 putative glucan -beta-glucosidase precursor protein [Lasiodiplodia theobromae]KAK0637722.1 Glucan 1 [Lasiodiplodia hormozganensis]